MEKQKAYKLVGFIPYIMQKIWLFLFRRVTRWIDETIRKQIIEADEQVILLRMYKGSVIGVPLGNKKDFVEKYKDGYMRIPNELHGKIRPLIENYMQYCSLRDYLDDEAEKYMEKIKYYLEDVDDRVKTHSLVVYKEMPIINFLKED